MQIIDMAGKYFCAYLNQTGPLSCSEEKNFENGVVGLLCSTLIGLIALRVICYSSCRRPAARALQYRVAETSLALLEQARVGNLKNVRALLARNPQAINGPNALGETPLILACKNGHYSIARELVQSGASLDAQDGLGKTALYHACEQRNINLVKLLNSANPNIPGGDGKTPLMVSAHKGDISSVRELLTFPDILIDYQKNETNQTALHLAAEQQANVFEPLLRAGANPHIPDAQGQLPLHVAGKKESHIGLKHLLSVTQDPNQRDAEGNTVAHIVCGTLNFNETQCCKVLLTDDRIDWSLRDSNQDAPIHLACNIPGFKIATELVNSGKVDLEQRNGSDKTPFQMVQDIPANADRRGETNAFLRILKAKLAANPRAVLSFDEALLQSVNTRKDLELFRCLEKMSPEEIRQLQINGQSLILWASCHLRSDIVRYLNRKKGIHLEISNPEVKEELKKAFFMRALEGYRYVQTILPIKIKEVREIIEALEGQEGAREKAAELLELLELGIDTHLKQLELISHHQMRGQHVEGIQLLAGWTTYGTAQMISFILPMVPEQFRKLILDPGALKAMIDAKMLPQWKEVFEQQEEISISGLLKLVRVAGTMGGAALETLGGRAALAPNGDLIVRPDPE